MSYFWESSSETVWKPEKSEVLTLGLLEKKYLMDQTPQDSGFNLTLL